MPFSQSMLPTSYTTRTSKRKFIHTSQVPELGKIYYIHTECDSFNLMFQFSAKADLLHHGYVLNCPLSEMSSLCRKC
jgi:hypothetical protein